jgi:hypothetical protein
VDEDIDGSDQPSSEIDLRNRLRSAADSLAADFGGTLTADHAEALVFSSAEGLLATASVTEFVPILAERRARLAVRSELRTEQPLPSGAAPRDDRPAVEPSTADPGSTDGAAPRPPGPLLAIPDEHVDRLRDRVDLIRVRVADWRAELDRR